MSPDKCRQRARECVELAQTASATHHRTMLLDMAAKWLQLAGLSQQEMEIVAIDSAQPHAQQEKPKPGAR